MKRKISKAQLHREHEPHTIRDRLEEPYRHNYIGDAILGAIDGCVTTFAVVAGSLGAGFSGLVAIVLGFSNLIADAFSMAVSNYQSTKAQREVTDQARRQEEFHIDSIPEGEREELRQIFLGKGFEAGVVEQMVETITSDRRLWVETMLTEELGLPINTPSPLRAATATFAAFVVVGATPLLPFFIAGLEPGQRFFASAVITAMVFYGIGMAKGFVLGRPIGRSGMETFLTGTGAALLAYSAARMVSQLYD